MLSEKIIPEKLRRGLRALQRRYGLHWPPAGAVSFGGLRRTHPISRIFGLDRGLPVDRYYIERFLADCSADIHGRVLEIGDDVYTRKFGGPRVSRVDVLHAVPGNARATLIADLSAADSIPGDTFDCIVCTQTLQMIYEARAAMRHLHRILKPGGSLLLSTHGISKIARREGIDPWGEYWRFTTQSLRRLLLEFFPPEAVTIRSWGNVLSAVAFLHGLAAHELRGEELDYTDPDYEVLLTVRAVKPDM